MSANVNVSSPSRKKKILVVAANPSTSTVTGWPVGFWWAELTHPYWTFTEAGYEVEIRSPPHPFATSPLRFAQSSSLSRVTTRKRSA